MLLMLSKTHDWFADSLLVRRNAQVNKISLATQLPLFIKCKIQIFLYSMAYTNLAFDVML